MQLTARTNFYLLTDTMRKHYDINLALMLLVLTLETQCSPNWSALIKLYKVQETLFFKDDVFLGENK